MSCENVWMLLIKEVLFSFIKYMSVLLQSPPLCPKGRPPLSGHLQSSTGSLKLPVGTLGSSSSIPGNSRAPPVGSLLSVMGVTAPPGCPGLSFWSFSKGQTDNLHSSSCWEIHYLSQSPWFSLHTRLCWPIFKGWDWLHALSATVYQITLSDQEQVITNCIGSCHPPILLVGGDSFPIL